MFGIFAMSGMFFFGGIGGYLQRRCANRVYGGIGVEISDFGFRISESADVAFFFGADFAA